MRLLQTKRSASFVRPVLGLLWIAGLSGVVAWSGCGTTVVVGSSASASSSSGAATSSSSGAAASSSSGAPTSSSSGASTSSSSSASSSGFCPQCPTANGVCNGYVGGQICPQPGCCCYGMQCDHMGGEDTFTFLCDDAGVWEPQ
jgi:hypothetical protein